MIQLVDFPPVYWTLICPFLEFYYHCPYPHAAMALQENLSLLMYFLSVLHSLTST